MNNQSCFVIPIHPPHFQRGKCLIESFQTFFTRNQHIFLVFSNKDDYNQFSKKWISEGYQPIIYTDPIFNSKPITQKKLFGVDYIFNNTDYEFVGVIDSDSVFIGHHDFHRIFSDYYERKTIRSSRIKNDGIRNNVLVNPVKKYFCSEHQRKLQNITENFYQYWWFNDIPVYKKDLFNEFIDFIKYQKIKSKIIYSDFDFILYSYFLLIHEYFMLEPLMFDHTKQIPITKMGSFIESQSEFDQDMFCQIFNKYAFPWIKTPAENTNSAFIKIHTDRV